MLPIIKQTWALSAVLINMFSQGMVLSFPTAILPALQQPDSPIRTDLHTGSWYASMVAPAAIPGVLLSSLIMELYGRRFAHGILILPGVIGWFLTYFAKDMTTLMIGRGLGGFTASATVSLGAVIIGEYSCPKYRGVFLYLKNAGVCIGATFVHSLSHFIHWKTISLIALGPSFMALIITCTWPESPSWLVVKQHYGRSEAAFFALRGNGEEACKELEDMIKSQMKRMLKPKYKLTFKQKAADFIKKLTKKEFVKPLGIMGLAALVLEVSGRHIFPAYAVQIISEFTTERTEVFYYTLAIDLIIAASALFSSFLVKVMTRRKLLFYTGFGSFAVLMIVCGYLFLVSKGHIQESSPLVSVSLFAAYFILTNLGCAPIPLTLPGEIFPLAHRGAGTALTGVWVSVLMMAALKATPHMLATVHMHGTFFIFGVILFFCLLILYFNMPETKDKTLQQIENYFNFGKYDIGLNDDVEAKLKMIVA